MERKSETSKLKKQFFSLYLGGLLIYLPLILLRLTNDMDGMWDQDDHVTGAAELRMGRWFWPILDKLRGNVSLDPLPAVVALALFAAGILVLFALFGLRAETRRERVFAWVIGMLALASPTVLCQLSYSHMSINDAFSFLLAVLAVWAVRDRTVQGKTAGAAECTEAACLTAVMMGCYQATLGVLCVMALFYFLWLLQRDTVKRALAFVGRMLASVVLGAALYEALLYACLAVTGETLSDYNGGNAVTLGGMLKGLPENLRHTYTAFGFYFGGNGYHFNLLQSHRWFLLVYLLPAAVLVRLIWKLWKEKRAAAAALAVLAILWIPVFANSFFLLVYSDTMMQMTMGMAMVLPLILCLWGAQVQEEGAEASRSEGAVGDRVPGGRDDSKAGRVEAARAGHENCIEAGKCSRAAAIGGGIAVFLLLYGMLGQTVTDQYAMYAGRRFCQTLGEQVLNRFTAAGADYTENVVLVYGTPKESPLFTATELYGRANSYAQYGSWAPGTEGNRLCWSHFLEQQLRVNANYAEGDTLETIYNSPEVAAMPVYPAAGSTANVWGVTVVKVSE